MTPGAHLLSSWLVANGFGLEQRERRLVSLAGLVPDLDGIGLAIDQINVLTRHETDFYEKFHHTMGHNLISGFAIAMIVGFLSRKRRAAAFGLSLLVYHLHLLCDLLGSRGPDGFQWPIRYLYPIDPRFELIWAGQWALNAWPNNLLLLALFAFAVAWGYRQRHSFLEVFSARLDREFFKMLGRRWPG